MTEIDFIKTPISELYGSNSFSNALMREKLPANIYKEILAVQSGEKELTLDVAQVVAAAEEAAQAPMVLRSAARA